MKLPSGKGGSFPVGREDGLRRKIVKLPSGEEASTLNYNVLN